MSIAQSMLGEFDMEMANTRKTLERVPDDKLGYKPDPKSMTLGRLASHIAEMVGWGKDVLTADEFDIDPEGTGNHKGYEASSRAQLLADFDKNAAAARKALESTPDQAMMVEWKLKAHGHTLMAMPRIACIRGMIMNHIIHHRAQLTVYYRLNGIPVPALYGPSADEGNMPLAAEAAK